MKARGLRLAAAAALPLLLLAACARKEKAGEGKELSKNPVAAMGQISDAARKAADAAREASEMKPVDPVSFNALLPLLPAAPAGFTAEEPRGETTAAMGFKISEVERSYTKGEQRLHVKIVDGAYNSFVYAGVTMAAQFSHESTEGYEKGVTIDGSPGVEKWSQASRRGELVVVVGKRFLVSVDASPAEADFVRTVFGSVDRAKLASLK
ncbi:MAG TPA: hypothetical protein VL084_06975 [Thermoanaerobaculia bacterium]|nr:hypothetical protein [Thermoanaerobaculia bacterium]